MSDRLLVLMPREQTHAPSSILEQARKFGPGFTEMRATEHMMELIAHSLCIANGAPAKVAREGWPGKMALLNGQSMGFKSELHSSPELTDAHYAHWQLMVGLKAQITRPAAKPMVICANFSGCAPLKGAVQLGDTWRPAHGERLCALLICS